MAEMDEEAEANFRAKVKELVRRASSGDRGALKELRDRRYTDVFPDMVGSGELRLGE